MAGGGGLARLRAETAVEGRLLWMGAVAASLHPWQNWPCVIRAQVSGSAPRMPAQGAVLVRTASPLMGNTVHWRLGRAVFLKVAGRLVRESGAVFGLKPLVSECI
ncbi:hypothetical protein KCU81_g254, partial [Aureobasidium melanogenum]